MLLCEAINVILVKKVVKNNEMMSTNLFNAVMRNVTRTISKLSKKGSKPVIMVECICLYIKHNDTPGL